MDTTLTFAANRLFDTFRSVEAGGKSWLVVNGVPLVEGVLNGRFVPADEFGSFVNDWNDIPVVLPHPKKNGGSARVPAPDVPVIGRFYNAHMDGKRLVGEYWLDKNMLESLDEGTQILESISNNTPIETSTGYWSESIPQSGRHNGRDYSYVDKKIHPDHIALLTQEVGACSLEDGCGMNRNESITKKEAWGNEPASSYLVVGDPNKVTTWHLPYKQHGKLDRRLAGRAWSELFSGGRTGKGYEGPDAGKAKAKLRKIYEDNDWPIPGEPKKNSLDGSYEKRLEDIHSSFMETMRIRDKRASELGSDTAVPMEYRVEATKDSYIIARKGSDLYKVGYTYNEGNGKVFFDDESEWIPVVKEERYVEKLMQNVTGSLPEAGKKLWEKVYNDNKDKGKESAAKIAWGAVKQAGWYQDKDGKWMKKTKQNQQALEELAVALLFEQVIDS